MLANIKTECGQEKYSEQSRHLPKSETDQEIPQSHFVDQPWHREDETQNTYSHKTSGRHLK